jgi:hypothetical protein
MLVAAGWLVGDISAASLEADKSGAHRVHSSTSVHHGADYVWDWSSSDLANSADGFDTVLAERP